MWRTSRVLRQVVKRRNAQPDNSVKASVALWRNGEWGKIKFVSHQDVDIAFSYIEALPQGQ
jgi:hypothetical protein